MIERRRMLLLLVGVLGSTRAALGQRSSKVARIGFLGFGPPASSANRVQAFRSGLNGLGYFEGQNLEIEYCWADNGEQLLNCADSLVKSKVDVIFATSSTEVQTAKQATKTIPIVFATHADPVGTGHVAALSHPGGNITGLTVVLPDLTAKALEILKELTPAARRFGMISDPTVASHRPAVEAAAKTAGQLGVDLILAPVTSVADFETAFEKLARDEANAVFVAAQALTVKSAPEQLARIAGRYRLPTMFGARDNVVAGGLASYSADHIALTRGAAVYIDKILRGERPADLPIEQASRYQLILNLKTATEIGVVVPPTLLGRADEVIE